MGWSVWLSGEVISVGIYVCVSPCCMSYVMFGCIYVYMWGYVRVGIYFKTHWRRTDEVYCTLLVRRRCDLELEVELQDMREEGKVGL